MPTRAEAAQAITEALQQPIEPWAVPAVIHDTLKEQRAATRAEVAAQYNSDAYRALPEPLKTKFRPTQLARRVLAETAVFYVEHLNWAINENWTQYAYHKAAAEGTWPADQLGAPKERLPEGTVGFPGKELAPANAKRNLDAREQTPATVHHAMALAYLREGSKNVVKALAMTVGTTVNVRQGSGGQEGLPRWESLSPDVRAKVDELFTTLAGAGIDVASLLNARDVTPEKDT